MNKVKITIDIEYDPDTLSDPDMIGDLAYHIERSVDYHISHGLLTGATSAEVDGYAVDVAILDTCKLCGKEFPVDGMHNHQQGWVCEGCWDERLRITE